MSGKLLQDQHDNDVMSIFSLYEKNFGLSLRLIKNN